MARHSIYGDLTKEQIANLSQEEKEVALLKWIMAKPTPATMLFYLTFVEKYFDEAFSQYLVNLAIADLKADGTEITSASIEENLQPLFEGFMTFPEELVEFYENYLKETGNKPPRAYKIAS